MNPCIYSQQIFKKVQKAYNGKKEVSQYTVLKLWLSMCKRMKVDSYPLPYKNKLKILYSVIKKKEIMLFACKQMERENIVLSKVSQAQKVKGHMLFLFCGSI
jgi:hypothetical protein